MKTNSEPSTAEELGLGQAVGLAPECRVDWNNWTLAPYNRWSFQRVQQLTRTARVSRASRPSTLARNERDFGSLRFDDSQGRSTTIAAMLQQTWTDAFLVMHRGEVLTEQYWNGMRPDTLHLMMSCSKSLTSTLVGIAVAEGQLDLAREISCYIPELEGTGMEGATVQQLLDMQVGLKFDEDYADLDGDWRDLEIATGWRPPEPGSDRPLDIVGYLQTLRESVGPHGALFHYQSILTDALGVCLERASGQTFIDSFAERIWHPIGAEQDLVTIVDAAGTAVFEGGFNCCLRDFARFAWLICTGGVADGRQIVPSEWIDECRRADAGLRGAFSRSVYGDELPGWAYHNKWWLSDSDRGVLMALGIHGQTLYIDPEREFIVAKFSSQPAADDIGLALDQLAGFEAIADQICR